MINNDFGFLRVFLPSIEIKKANVEENLLSIINIMKQSNKEDIGLLVLPPLPLTSTDCGSLFTHYHLYKRQCYGIKKIVEESRNYNFTILLTHYEFQQSKLIYKLSIIKDGKIFGNININHLTHKESLFFNKSDDNCCHNTLFFDEQNQISIGLNSESDIQIFLNSKDYVLHQEEEYINQLKSSSLKHNNVGLLNSKNGLCIIAENGKILSKRSFFDDTKGLIYDVDIDLIKSARVKNHIKELNKIPISSLSMWQGGTLKRNFSTSPFLSENKIEKYKTCMEIFSIQVEALASRIKHTHSKKTVIGVSGGLDSTLALLVATFAHKKLNMPISDILAVTMPGFGTTDRTYQNAVKMIHAIGTDFKEISIVDAVKQHFKDIDHQIEKEDITFENAQARERTQILMDLANKHSGIVLGTGDLSEIALGWCTFNGDHMSMYGINSGVPKTVIQEIVGWFIENPLKNSDYFLKDTDTLAKCLQDILDTPISPELLSPLDKNNTSQKTEDKVGPYILHDFFIYHTLAFGVSPKKLLFISSIAFDGTYSREFIKKWLIVFYKRFFQQQFKRNCSADSPVIFENVNLNYNIWLMDSDISADEWIKELS